MGNLTEQVRETCEKYGVSQPLRDLLSSMAFRIEALHDSVEMIIKRELVMAKKSRKFSTEVSHE